MAFHSPSDFSFMFDTTHGWGVSYTWSFDASSVRLIVDNDNLDSSEFDVQDYRISARALTSEITDIAQGQTFTSGTTVYLVTEIGPDNHGVTELGLRLNG